MGGSDCHADAEVQDLFGRHAGEGVWLDEFYATVRRAIDEVGFESLLTEDLEPRSNPGQYLQYHYIVDNPNEDRSQLSAAPVDDSEYGLVHEELHPRLLELRSQLGFGDLLLVDSAGNIVYSTNKRLDYATNATTGPHRNTGMGRAITNGIAAAPVGDAVFVDFELYLPAAGKPALFVAAAVRDEAQTVGALLVEIPVAALNSLTTGEGNWEANSLGDTGEVYVVGRDLLMRTDSRELLEDPEDYQRELESQSYDPMVSQLINTFGSTVLLQPVETKGVIEALDGEPFLGSTTNYLGRRSLTAAGPVGSDKVDWVVVAEIASSEANDPLNSFLIRLLIEGLILIPLVVLLALLFADRITRPVKPVVAAASAVAGGDLDATVPDLGRNEFGDAGRRLNRLTATLREKEEAIAAEEEKIRNLLLSALPARLVEMLRRGNRSLLDLVDTATVVVFDIDGVVGSSGIEEEAGVELSADFSANMEAIADQLGLERVRSSTEQHVFAAGLDAPDAAVEAAAEFALAVARMTEDFEQEHGLDMTYRAGLSAGDVIAGLLRAEQLTYGVFGYPPRTALALAGIAGPNQILIEESAAADLGPAWSTHADSDLIDLRGDEVAAVVLDGRQPEVAAVDE